MTDIISDRVSTFVDENRPAPLELTLDELKRLVARVRQLHPEVEIEVRKVGLFGDIDFPLARRGDILLITWGGSSEWPKRYNLPLIGLVDIPWKRERYHECLVMRGGKVQIDWTANPGEGWVKYYPHFRFAACHTSSSAHDPEKLVFEVAEITDVVKYYPEPVEYYYPGEGTWVEYSIGTAYVADCILRFKSEADS